MTPKTLAVMIDCSRNGVMKPEKVKEFALIIKNMGYNALMLYTEDTYEVPEYPYFGYMRGGYTQKQLQELDARSCSDGRGDATYLPSSHLQYHESCREALDHSVEQ